MEDHHKKALAHNTLTLMEEFDPCDVLDHLISNGVISSEDKMKIISDDNRQNMVSLFLATLQKRGKASFRVFIEALEVSGEYAEMKTSLTEQARTFQIAMEKMRKELTDNSNESEPVEFLEMKWHLAKGIGKPEASKLRKHFSLPAIKENHETGIGIVIALEEKKLITPKNVCELQKAAEILGLTWVYNIVADYTRNLMLPEIQLQLFQREVLNSEKQEPLRKLPLEKLSSNVSTSLETLRNIFRQHYNAVIWNFAKENGVLLLKVSSLHGLGKLRADINSKNLEKMIFPILAEDRDSKGSATDAAQSTLLDIEADVDSLSQAEEKLTSLGLDNKLQLFLDTFNRNIRLEVLKMIQTYFDVPEDKSEEHMTSSEVGTYGNFLHSKGIVQPNNVTELEVALRNLECLEYVKSVQEYQKAIDDLLERNSQKTKRKSTGELKPETTNMEGKRRRRISSEPNDQPDVFKDGKRKSRSKMMEDISQKIGVEEIKRQKTLSKVKDQPEISDYRLKLRDIEKELTKEQVNTMGLLADLTPQQQDEMERELGNGFQRLIRYLEKEEKLSEKNLLFLRQLLLKVKTPEEVSYLLGDLYEKDGYLESNHVDNSNSRQDFRQVLLALGLDKYFQGKLKLRSFMKVEDVADETDFVHYFWQHLLQLDVQSWLFKNPVAKITPIRDFIFCLLYCADDFLRQNIFERISACKLAVPVLLQGMYGSNPQFLLWSMRKILTRCSGRDISSGWERPIVSCPLFTVSVVRIGNIGISKSNFLNSLLSYVKGSRHDYFIASTINSRKPKFASGSIECTWLHPPYFENESGFDDSFAFLNFRGDCKEYSKETAFVSEIADVVVAFTAEIRKEEYKEVRRLKEINKNVILVLTGEKKSSDAERKKGIISLSNECLILNLSDKTIHRMLYDEVICVCRRKGTQKTLESVRVLCEKYDIEIDEQNVQCSEAIKAVGNVFSCQSVEKQDINVLKKSTFQLQFAHQQFLQGDRHGRRKDVCLSQQRKNTEVAEKNMREQQIRKQFSPTMQKYVEGILNCKENLDYLYYVFGSLHEKMLQMLHKGTQNVRDKIIKSEAKMETQSSCFACKEEKGYTTEESKPTEIAEDLRKLYKALRADYVGCELFLQELKQLYEAFTEVEYCPLKIDETDIKNFPEFAAKILHEIHAFQLVEEGDNNLSLSWATTVLNASTSMLKDPRVYVISVIGIQNSSTSTFIDDLFGVRYPVRVNAKHGLFVRLLRLSDILVKKLHVNYLIVMETEGVRLDKDRLEFENKVTSLAISLSNMTLFVMEEESKMEDVIGILDIACHALIRSETPITKKLCKILRKSSTVEDVQKSSAGDTARIKVALNEAIKIVTGVEEMQGSFKDLSDMMEVEICKPLVSLPCTQTENYTNTILRLKAHIFESITKETKIVSPRLSSFSHNFQNVWKQIHRQNYYFKFADAMTGISLNSFFMHYTSLKAKMREEIDHLTYKFLSEATNGLLKGEFMCNIETWKSALKEKADEQKQKLLNFLVNYNTEQVKGKLTHAYQSLIRDDISKTTTEILKEAPSILLNEYEFCKAKYCFELEFKLDWKVELTKKAVQFAKILGESKREDSELEALYDVEWDKWMKMIQYDINKGDITAKHSSLEAFCENVLLEITRFMAVGSEIKSLVLDEGGLTNHCNVHDWSKYICKHHLNLRLGTKILSSDNTCVPEDEEAKLKQFVKQTIDRNLQNLFPFQRQFIRENSFQIIIEKALKDFLSGNKCRSNLRIIAKGILHFCGKVVQKLQTFMRERQLEISNILKTERQVVLEDFLVFCKGSNHDLRAAEFLYYSIEMLYRIKTRNVHQDVRRKFDYKKGTTCLQEPLQDLLHFAASTDPTMLMEHTMNPVINAYVKREQDKLMSQLHKDSYGKVQLFVPKLMETVTECEKELPVGATFQNWCDRIGDFLGSHNVKMTGQLFTVCDKSTVSSLLKTHINEKLMGMLIRDSFGKGPLIVVNKLADAIGLGKLCYDRCPLCGVHCDKIADGHTIHSSSLHRPRGFGGATYPYSLDLVAEDCVTSIRSKTDTFLYMLDTYPCYKYKDKFPSWEINATSDSQKAKIFWRWLFVQKLQGQNGHQLGSLRFPLSWLDITKEEAIQSLRDAIGAISG